MIERVIIAHRFQPSSAATNRIIAYAKGFAHENCEVYLVLGCENQNELPAIDGVQVIRAEIKHRRCIARRMASAIKSFYTTNQSVILIYGSPILCWYFDKSKYNIFYECTEVPFYGRKKTIVSWLKESVKILLARRATGMLVISQALKHYYEGKGITRIAVINMFVDSGRFAIDFHNKQKEYYVGYCGTISPFKDGVDVLLKAFALFHKSHEDYQLKLMGRFESRDSEFYLKKLVESLQITDFVCFTGVISPEDIPILLCNSHMLVLARPDNDQAKYGFPTKLGEYLATGKPVVVTNVGEIGGFMKDFYNCRLAKPGDVNDFAEKMSWVADHYEEALLIGLKGKLLTETVFSSTSQCKKALSFMEDHIQ